MTDPGKAYEQLRADVEARGTATVRTVDLGVRALVIAVAVFALIVGLVLPWVHTPGGDALGFEILFGFGPAEQLGVLSVPRLFAFTSTLFGILASALALNTRRWGMTWIAAIGGWFAAVDGLLAIWTEQSLVRGTTPGPGAGLGMVIAEAAMVVLAILWFRTAWSRDPSKPEPTHPDPDDPA
ncbi:Rv2732c family membrane protein [Actinokineospora bangkokensis]|uniref:Uncharacterized protein n=1 Tax=Actinokineospora bangkokensis TaxID=1193682 RepID=A0A1Q9LT73_9PSEU|nr:hypothetical protein [Actinokineospora bangkokensis]OLR95201.1 hypothetical protein BJP25_07865 [Actinokineospora bangkokensis]